MAMRVLVSGGLGAAPPALASRTCHAIRKAEENTNCRTSILAPMPRLLSHHKKQKLTRYAVSERSLALSSHSHVLCAAFRILLIDKTLPRDIPQTQCADCRPPWLDRLGSCFQILLAA